MKANKLISILLIVMLLNIFLLGQSVNAKNINKQHVSLGSHVHGLSELTLVIEGEKLNIQLTSPMVNLVGFEHRASNKKEIALVNNAKVLLGNTASLFSFSGGDCSLIHTAINVSALTTEGEHQPKDNKTLHDDHSEQQISHENNHTQVVTNYRYHCEEKSTLLAIDVLLFDQFPGINQIRAVWITDIKQGVATLSAESKIMRL